MERICGNCVYYGASGTRIGPSRYSRARCLLSGKRVNSMLRGCRLHWSEQDRVTKQQAQDEKWRSGASVSLAVPE